MAGSLGNATAGSWGAAVFGSLDAAVARALERRWKGARCRNRGKSNKNVDHMHAESLKLPQTARTALILGLSGNSYEKES